jgi:hypothetical protein
VLFGFSQQHIFPFISASFLFSVVCFVSFPNEFILFIYFFFKFVFVRLFYVLGGQDSLVDKALDYRPKGTGFDPRLDHKRRST